MSKKMIVTDLDGTLLDSHKNISDYTAQIFEECKKRGFVTAIATARSSHSSTYAVSRIKPDILISSGGSLAQFNGEVLYEEIIPNDIVKSIANTFYEEPTTKCITVESVEAGYFVDEPNLINSRSWRDYSHTQPFDFANPFPYNAYKLTVSTDNSDFADSVIAKFPQLFCVRYTGDNWFSFTLETATKWLAIEAIAEKLHISISDIYAFGDDFNDIAMIKNCGKGIAMTNAIDEVVAVSDFRCGTNDHDGVAKWIEENLF